MNMETELALLKQSQQNMEDKLESIETKLDKFIDKCDKEYVKKEYLHIIGGIVVVAIPVILFIIDKLWK